MVVPVPEHIAISPPVIEDTVVGFTETTEVKVHAPPGMV
jgi:hypothetical protein